MSFLRVDRELKEVLFWAESFEFQSHKIVGLSSLSSCCWGCLILDRSWMKGKNQPLPTTSISLIDKVHIHLFFAALILQYSFSIFFEPYNWTSWVLVPLISHLALCFWGRVHFSSRRTPYQWSLLLLRGLAIFFAPIFRVESDRHSLFRRRKVRCVPKKSCEIPTVRCKSSYRLCWRRINEIWERRRRKEYCEGSTVRKNKGKDES